MRNRCARWYACKITHVLNGHCTNIPNIYTYFFISSSVCVVSSMLVCRSSLGVMWILVRYGLQHYKYVLYTGTHRQHLTFGYYCTFNCKREKVFFLILAYSYFRQPPNSGPRRGPCTTNQVAYLDSTVIIVTKKPQLMPAWNLWAFCAISHCFH